MELLAPPLVAGGTRHDRILSMFKGHGSWRVLVLVLLLLSLYLQVIIRMVEKFLQDPGYSHGLVVPFFSAYIVWLKRKQLLCAVAKPAMAGLWLVLGGIAMLFLGSMAAELFIARLSLVVVLFGLVIFFWGKEHARILLFPLSFLLLMIPIPAIIYNALVFPLQLLSSRLATKILNVINIMPVLREGNLLVLPNCTLEVVEACSGIRSLLSLLTLAIAYGYLAERHMGIRAFLAVSMVPVAILGNGFRVVLAALVAHYRGPEAMEGFLHPLSSLVIAVVALVCLFLLHGASKLTEKGFRALAGS